MRNVTPTRIHVVLLDEDVAIRLDDHTYLLTTTPNTCDRLITALHQARDLLIKQQTARSERAERYAAAAVNVANAEEHRAWGSTLQGTVTPTETVVKTVTFEDCGCSRMFICDEHVAGDVA